MVADRLRLDRFVRLFAVGLLMAALAAVLVPAAGVSAASAQTITHISTSNRVILLTLDTDTVRGYTSGMLDTLEAKGVRASFGVTGTFASNNGDLVTRMARDGDTLMNHSWDHPYFTQISSAKRISELQQTDTLIQQLTGTSTKPFFRPPYGDYNSSVLADVGSAGYLYNVYWSIDPQGWSGKSASEITSIILSQASPGAIVLMHTFAAGDAGALPGVIDQLRARGYSFATLDDYFGDQTPPPPPPPTSRYFPETGHTVGGGFFTYWNSYGGLPTFGYPLTDEFQQVSPTDGKSYTVQYFERARFEYHPEFAGTVYEVELGLLGVQLAQQQGLLGTAPFQRVSAQSDASCTYYAPTGHRLCFGFRAFWQSHGGLMIYGYPISEEFTDPATGLTVQYFERQRLEWHPNNPPAWQVEGGLLGSQLLPAQP